MAGSPKLLKCSHVDDGVVGSPAPDPEAGFADIIDIGAVTFEATLRKSSTKLVFTVPAIDDCLDDTFHGRCSVFNPELRDL
jgi:hypothetical protein